MNNYIRCCAICGCEKIIEYTKTHFCSECFLQSGNIKKIVVFNSQNTKDYYKKLSLKQFGTPDNWKIIFIKEELSKNPYFSQSRCIKNLQSERKMEEAILKRKVDMELNPDKYKPYNPKDNPNVPKCPTCGSTNIKKIPTINRAASVALFGFASSKIGKQFECLNCKYKW